MESVAPGTVGLEHAAGEGLGEGPDRGFGPFGGVFDEEGNGAQVEGTSPGKGLKRITYGPVGRVAPQGVDAQSPGGVGHGGSEGGMQQGGNLLHGRVADGDQVEVGGRRFLRVFRVVGPVAFGECPAPPGVACAHLLQVQTVACGDGSGQGFGHITAPYDRYLHGR